MSYLKKIPVVVIIRRVFSSVKNNAFALIRFGLPVIVVELLSTIYYGVYESDKMLFADFSPPGLLITALNIAAYAMAIVGIHRVFILPPEVVANTSIVRWTPRESRWLGWSLVIIFWVILLSLIPGCMTILSYKGEFSDPNDSTVTAEAFGWLLGLFIGYFTARWSLIFPSIATDGELKNLSDAWDFSRGNVLALFILVGVIPTLTTWVMSALPIDRPLSLSIAVLAVSWVVAVFQIGLLSHSYAFLTSGDGNETE